MQEKLHMKQHPGTNPPTFRTTISGITDDGLHLSESYCYPRGGGQPGDIGIISSSDHSVEFSEALGGEFILHPVEDPSIFIVGEGVECEIDAIRRNRNTRMHTAQHVFSAMANELYGAETVGNQISEGYTRIDLWFPDRDQFNADDMAVAVNDALRTDSNVSIHEWDRNRILSHEQMRHTKFMDRIPSSIEMLRVVEIEGIDLCPCGGTHVANTSDVDEISITNSRSKGAGKLRITYE
ncbi:MAG: alanyl-tRNA editing protein [Candidatus Thermoplasmatota archaeon]|jgi:misacylated tRNA(Ala) deacylase|nr:alanyl-tRNA editing protein [Candidatus Thermoplasmatota archaeon]MED5274079.1 alanyl-tRNA editing protein [Candidatus Thermoplasmatota archaeon]